MALELEWSGPGGTHVRDDTVEAGALVAEAVLACGELTEVPRGLGDNVVKELEDDATGGLSVDVDVKLEAKQRWLINIDLGCYWAASLGDSEGNRQERQRDTHVDVGHRGEGNEGREDEEAL